MERISNGPYAGSALAESLPGIKFIATCDIAIVFKFITNIQNIGEKINLWVQMVFHLIYDFSSER